MDRGCSLQFLDASFLFICSIGVFIFLYSDHILLFSFSCLLFFFNFDDVLLYMVKVRRLKEFGVTNGELARYTDALLKDSEQLAAMIDNVSSVDNLDFVMESDALGHTVMDQSQGHESLLSVAGTITLEEVIV